MSGISYRPTPDARPSGESFPRDIFFRSSDKTPNDIPKASIYRTLRRSGVVLSELIRTIRHFSQRTSGYDVLRVLLGVLLLVAAGLKCYQLATVPIAATGLLSARWFLIGVVQFELAFGVWLIVGHRARETWRVAIVCFAVFAGVNLYQAISGAVSCGCFGTVSTSPWWTLVGDSIALVALYFCRPACSVDACSDEASSTHALSSSRRVIVAGVTFILLAVPATLAITAFAPVELSAAGELSGDSNVVLLEPEKWIGKPLPLLKYTNVDVDLASGDWMVVLYHHDCTKCQELVAEYEFSNENGVGEMGQRKVALIEMPPYAPEHEYIAPRAPHFLRARLKDDIKWIAVTPVEISLNHGIVAAVSTAVLGNNARGRTRLDLSQRGLEPTRRHSM